MTNATDAVATPERNLIERFLGLFARVNSGECITAIILTLDVFLILTAYYVLKTVREPMILLGGMGGLEGDELKTYASAGQAFLLIGVIPLYGKLASSGGRMKLINITTGFFIACLALFNVLAQLDVPLGLAFYLWLGIFNVMIIAQFWSYANDLYTNEQGKRLFAIIAVGGSLGSIFGSGVATIFIEPLGQFQLMLVAAALLGTALALTNIVNKRETGPDQADGIEPHDEADEPLAKDGGFQLVIRSRYLLLIALMLLVANLVNTTGEFILSTLVKSHAEASVQDTEYGRGERLLPKSEVKAETERQAAISKKRGQVIGKFYGTFSATVNTASFVVQAFVVSRVLTFLGVRFALFILPLIALGGYALIAFIPALLMVRISKTGENSVDYSLQNTVRQALFLPTSREVKYKAKAAIDTFFVRFGDTAAAGLVFAGLHLLDFSVRSFAFTNVVLVGLWLLIVFGISREHKKMAGDESEAAANAG